MITEQIVALFAALDRSLQGFNRFIQPVALLNPSSKESFYCGAGWFRELRCASETESSDLEQGAESGGCRWDEETMGGEKESLAR